MKPRRPSKLRYAKQYERFRERLVDARHRTNMTQREVAERLGRPPSFVANCESGERRVDVVELQAFAQLYRKSILHFVKE